MHKLLLVEDSEDDAHLALSALEKLDLELRTHWAKDGLEALGALGLLEHSTPECEHPDLVICDVKMPKVGGVEVLQRIRASKRLSGVPVVMLSTSTFYLDVDRCMQCGANDYCFKPLDGEEFFGCVQDIARRWLSGSESDIRPRCLIDSDK